MKNSYRPSPVDVERKARSISRISFSGSKNVVRRKTNHVILVAETLRYRWGVDPSNWQVKHIRWFFDVYLCQRSSGTQYRYFRLLRTILKNMNRWDDWQVYLGGRWSKP